MKKVALIIKSLRNGGAERVVSILSQSFTANYELDIILFDGREIDYDYRGNIIDLKFYNLDNIFFKIFHFLKNPIKTHRLLSIKKKNKYDTVISFVSTPNKLNIQTKLPHENCIVTVHNHLSSTKNFQLKKSSLAILYKKANHIIAVSEGVKKDLVENFQFDKNVIKVIYNPIEAFLPENCDEKKLSKKLLEIFNNYDVLVNAGSLNDQKSQWNLIRAFSEVHKHTPSTKLIIFGRGKYFNDYQKMIDQMNLQDCVILAGFTQELLSYLHKAKLFLLTSSFEGFGNVIVEALSCGVPIVTTDCESGPREILAPNTNVSHKIVELELTQYGYLTPMMSSKFKGAFEPISDEEHLFSTAILHLLHDQELYFKIKKQTIERSKSFLIDTILKSWKDII